MYTLYTDSHRELFDNYFMASLPSDVEIFPTHYPQYSKNGVFGHEGWKETMIGRVNVILQAIEDNWGQPFIYADCDVQFFGDITAALLAELGDNDIAFQNDNFQYCAGFLVAKANQSVKDLYTEVKDRFAEFSDDQDGINKVEHKCKAVKLSDRFWTVGLQTEMRLWTDAKEFTIPSNILIHHANWTLPGIAEKIKLMNIVRAQYADIRR
jgi:hypothetical protein